MSSETAAARADAAFRAFIAAYLNADRRTFWSLSDHSVNRGKKASGYYADYWWIPEFWELVMDEYERTGDAAARRLIDDVYDGALARYPNLANTYNDDLAWWALASVRAYTLTGERRFLDRSEAVFALVWKSWDDTYGGGIWWRQNVRDQKNIATNGPEGVAAVRLYEATHDPTYLRDGIAVFDWIDSRLRDGDVVDDHVEGAGSGSANGWQLTYNYGLYDAAAAGLYGATGDRTYLERAVSTAGHAVATLAPGGVLPDEGGRDGGPLKGIFVRGLGGLIRSYGQTQFEPFVAANAAAAWANRNPAGLVGSSWTEPASGPIESGAASSAVAVLELAALLR